MKDEELYELEKNSSLVKKFKYLFKEDDVFWNNEIKANLFTMNILLAMVFILILSYILTITGVFAVPVDTMKNVLEYNLPIVIIAMIICQYFKGSKHWIKYLLLGACLFVSFGLCGVLSIYTGLVLVIPVCLSVRYYSRKFTILIAVISIIGMIIAEIVYGLSGVLDLNLVAFSESEVTLNILNNSFRDTVMAHGYDITQYIINLFRGSFAPRFLFFTVIATICAELARRAHEMVLEQTEILQKTEAIKTELNMATNIQSAVLPKIFPAFPAHPELDIYATMDPAKEVGGDFYDYYLIDEDHLLMVIADVSGKGVPAALFMMIAKMMIKTYSSILKTPSEIASEVNKQLCDGNEAQMFVTAWIGILQLSTGIVTAVDAGHEYPYIKRKNGKFEMVKNKKSFVLAGLANVKFREFTFEFNRGDTIYMYTDGVPEATNAQLELYGTDNLEKALNKYSNDDPKQLLEDIRKDVDEFVKDAPQFDDMTMLCMHFKEESDTK